MASGHSFESLIDAHLSLKEACTATSAPGVIIAETTKGSGLGELANTVDCHYLPLSDTQYSEAITRLHKDYPYS
jgi:transketolase